MFQQHLPLFFFSKGFSSQPCSVGLSVPVVYVAVSQQPTSLVSPCSPSGMSLSPLFPPVVYVAVSQQPSLPAPLRSPLFARPSLPAPLRSPLFARLSLLAPPCLSLSSLFPPVVYVAVLQQPSCRPCYGVLFLSLPVLHEKKFCSLEISE